MNAPQLQSFGLGVAAGMTVARGAVVGSKSLHDGLSARGPAAHCSDRAA
ncbi:MAG: hypothetical protein L0G69_07435 [Brevibacterium sp.]|nr:hypothetical protein [Brevibacterium sp.]